MGESTSSGWENRVHLPVFWGKSGRTNATVRKTIMYLRKRNGVFAKKLFQPNLALSTVNQTMETWFFCQLMDDHRKCLCSLFFARLPWCRTYFATSWEKCKISWAARITRANSLNEKIPNVAWLCACIVVHCDNAQCIRSKCRKMQKYAEQSNCRVCM